VVTALARRASCPAQSQWHIVGSGNRHVPLTAVGLLVTHRDGGTQDGPVSVLHDVPSGASATHVPGVDPWAPKQVDALVQPLTTWLTDPHCAPAVTYTIEAQVSVPPSQ
jgi:hypothetical protein